MSVRRVGLNLLWLVPGVVGENTTSRPQVFPGATVCPEQWSVLAGTE